MKKPVLLKVANITNSPGRYDVDVVGESHYQDALEGICGGRSEESQRLVIDAVSAPENNNPHDPKAVGVWIDDQMVGYMDRENARIIRQQMANISNDEIALRVSAIIVGGWDRGEGDRGYFGVKLDLPTT